MDACLNCRKGDECGCGMYIIPNPDYKITDPETLKCLIPEELRDNEYSSNT